MVVGNVFGCFHAAAEKNVLREFMLHHAVKILDQAAEHHDIEQCGMIRHDDAGLSRFDCLQASNFDRVDQSQSAAASQKPAERTADDSSNSASGFFFACR